MLLSIHRVTQINKGKRTAGVDGYKSLLRLRE
ncbi:reverse transcriptase N-terminal domain-containing protein [Neobacillus sp. WH10]